MEVVIAIAAVGAGLLLLELLAPTGGLLAVLGALGMVAAGVVAIATDADVAEYIGPGLIALGVLSAIAFFVITRKVLRAHRDPVHSGREEMVGLQAEARTRLDPDGQVWVEGALWRARLDHEAPTVSAGDRVVIDSVDGLTLVVRPLDSAGDGREEPGRG